MEKGNLNSSMVRQERKFDNWYGLSTLFGSFYDIVAQISVAGFAYVFVFGHEQVGFDTIYTEVVSSEL